MYSFKQLFNQEPAAIKSFFVLVVGALVLSNAVNVSSEVLLAWAVPIEVFLNLFYVRRKTVSKDALSNLVDLTSAKSELPAEEG